ncbi:MAG: hypothetical protein ACR2RE_30745, partial [Geminicoccaceae bacterium]
LSMKVDSPMGMNSKLGGRHRRPATLDRNGIRKEGSSISPVQMKTDTKQPRRRKPRQSDDQKRGHMLDITT